jgi:hypothetical protein
MIITVYGTRATAFIYFSQQTLAQKKKFALKKRATRLRRFQSETKSTERWYILNYEVKLNLPDRGALKAIPGPSGAGMFKGSQISYSFFVLLQLQSHKNLAKMHTTSCPK